MAPAFPPTVIVRHGHENKKKCTVWPLRGRPGLVFVSYPVTVRPNLEGYVRAGGGTGRSLSPADAAAGVLLLDGSLAGLRP